MASVGSLIVDLRGNTAQFQRDMGRANHILRQNVSSMERSVAGLTRGFAAVNRVAAAFGAALSVGTVVNFFRQAAVGVADLQDLSDQLNFNVEALQALQAAGRDAGIGAETVTAGITRLNEAIGEATGGNREMQKSFVDLGVSFRTADGEARRGEAVFNDLAKQYDEAGDKTKFLSDVTNIMGRQAGNLRPVFEQAAVGVDILTQSMKEAGQVASADLVKNLDMLTDHVGRFANWLNIQGGKAVHGWQLLLGFGLTDETKITQKFEGMFADLERLRARRKELTESGSPEGITNMLAPLDEIIALEERLRLLQLMQKKLQGVSATVPVWPTASSTAPSVDPAATKAATKSVEEYTSALDEMVQGLREQVSVAGEAGLAQEQLKAQYELNAAVLKDYEAGIRDSALATDAEIASVDGAVRALHDLDAARQNHLDVLQFQREEEERLADQHERTIDTMVTGLTRLGSGLANSLLNFRSWREVAAEAVETVFNILMQLAQQTAFFGLFGGGGFSTANLGGTGPGIPPIKPIGFAMGGSFTVGGAGGTDSKMVAFRATPGEMVNISKPGHGSGETTVIVNNYSSERASTREGRGSDGRKIIDVTIGQAAAKDISSRGPMSQTLESTYGLKRMGR